jgi:ADP-dependent NAD(P)H-hydrate dehydratase / NAD(P)H-hydrate epimerase
VKILTAEAMQAVDRRLIEEIGLPSLVLMENAALGVVEAIGERYPRALRVVAFCGPGNNGADGLAVVRLLAARGAAASAVLLRGGRPLSADAATQLGICQRLGLTVLEVDEAEELEAALDEAREAEVVVDALFGTGLSRALDGLFAQAVDAMMALERPIVAVDLPSGLFGSLPGTSGSHVVADLTVTFAAPKIAHVFAPAADACGELAITDLGAPSWVVDEAESDLEWLEAEEVAAAFPARPRAAHKGSFGHLLLVAGGPGRVGAAVLAALAAVRTGAGLVTVATPAGVRDAVDLGSLESMTLALPVGDDGELAAAAGAAILDAARGKEALALGPGLGRQPGAERAIRAAALGCPLPVLLDADGLNAFAGRLEALADRTAPTVLTPHPGEMARLLGWSVREVENNRLAAVRAAARRARAVVVLKGYQSLIADSEGGVAVSSTGCPAMASGGAGDVLTGMIAALLAQGAEPARAARAGVYVHGLAGERTQARLGGPVVPAGELLTDLPATLEALSRRS